MKRAPLALLLLVLLAVHPALAAEALKPGDNVAIIGDSITEQKLYSLYMESYLLMCKPVESLTATQFGWSGETAGGFLGRMNYAFVPFKANAATTCYGMNDGGYSPMNPGKAKTYRDNQTAIVRKMKEAGVRFIVVGSPGAVDFDTFRKGDPAQPPMYNKTLSELRDIAREVAEKEGVAFANVFDPMIAAMGPAKAKYGKDYHVCGGDGFHPGPNGHLIMAYAFLKGLGCDGHIGTITLDLASGKAEASEGHKVLAAKDGSIELESSRYPYCFDGDPKSPNATSGIIEFFPFNDDLNRFKLVVKTPGADKLKVTWGATSKEFSAADLAKGVNLAAEFLDNPFREPFKAVQAQIANKQNMETPLIKSLIQNLPSYSNAVPTEKDAIERILNGLVAKDVEARKNVAALVKPVKHTIKVEAVK
jgi:lysophospholipase L1-like esterase